MRIWYFHHYGTPYEIPGLHRPFEFGEYFCKSGNDVTVFTSSYLHYGHKNMIEDNSQYLEKQYDGVRTVFVKTCGYENKIKRVLNMVQFGYRLKLLSKEIAKKHGSPDIIIASSPHPLTFIAGIKTAKMFNIPCVCEVRDFWPEVFFLGDVIKEKGLLGRALLSIERRIYEKAESLVFLKEGDHTYITEHGWDKDNGGSIDMQKCHYVNNGVDNKLFEKRKLEYVTDDEDLNSDKFKVIYCGTIRPINNVEMLADVAKLLDNECMVLVYGDGNCRQIIEKKIKDESINNIKLKGFVDNKYIPYILSNATVNVLNYSDRGYNWTRGNSSNKLFEYFAASKPVVSTVKMGYDPISKYEAGISSDKCDARSIAQAIEHIKHMNKDEYMKMCIGAKKAAMDFDIEKLSDKYMEILVNTVKQYKEKQRETQ